MDISWPFVALAGLGGGFFLGLYALIPSDQPEGRTALLGIVTLAGNAVVGAVAHRINSKVKTVDTKLADVQDKVNGRMSELIAKTQPAADVSRETESAPARVAKKVAAAPKVRAAKTTAAKATQVGAKKRAR